MDFGNFKGPIDENDQDESWPQEIVSVNIQRKEGPTQNKRISALAKPADRDAEDTSCPELIHGK